MKSRWCYATSKSLAEHYIYGLNQTKKLEYIISVFLIFMALILKEELLIHLYQMH